MNWSTEDSLEEKCWRAFDLSVCVCVLLNSNLGYVIFGSGVVAEEVQPQEGDAGVLSGVRQKDRDTNYQPW